MNSLLYSLVYDDSSTVCTISLTVLIKLLPIFAVKACDDLKRFLPQLLLVLARILCWKERQSSSARADIAPEDTDEENVDEDQPESEGSRPLSIREDIDWARLKLTFSGAVTTAPSAHRYFTFLYYLFPCNTIRFLRCPVKYLNESGLESFYTVSWEDALDEEKIRSTSEVRHPALWSHSRMPTSPVSSATIAHACSTPSSRLAPSRRGARPARFLVPIRYIQDR